MRQMIVLGLGAVLTLSACSKKSEEPTMPSSPPLETAAPASAAPAVPTADQKAMVAALPAPYNAADPANGEAKFALCRSCHTIAKGAPNLTGPNLWGVYGQKAAQTPDFSFSDGLKAANLTFDAPTLDKWITDPRVLVPNTKMTFLGVKDAKDRADIIAYIATQRDK